MLTQSMVFREVRSDMVDTFPFFQAVFHLNLNYRREAQLVRQPLEEVFIEHNTSGTTLKGDQDRRKSGKERMKKSHTTQPRTLLELGHFLSMRDISATCCGDFYRRHCQTASWKSVFSPVFGNQLW
ncbi:hypothetical protein XENOCAPTIV_011073 [Xenoophorus captivus]|uniref:Uncharacterized protein n=1 Tax=Xenoophorus captivus TaxID=1517983 RepID=A0ABV0Q4T4_9TELE